MGEKIDGQMVIEYYHLLRKDAEVMGIPADLYETESRKATVETVRALQKTFEKLIEDGMGEKALLRGPTNWGVSRTVLCLLEKYSHVAMWYPQLKRWQMFARGESKGYILPVDSVKEHGA